MKENPTLTNSQEYFKQFRPGNNEVSRAKVRHNHNPLHATP